MQDFTEEQDRMETLRNMSLNTWIAVRRAVLPHPQVGIGIKCSYIAIKNESNLTYGVVSTRKQYMINISSECVKQWRLYRRFDKIFRLGMNLYTLPV